MRTAEPGAPPNAPPHGKDERRKGRKRGRFAWNTRAALTPRSQVATVLSNVHGSCPSKGSNASGIKPAEAAHLERSQNRDGSRDWLYVRWGSSFQATASTVSPWMGRPTPRSPRPRPHALRRRYCALYHRRGAFRVFSRRDLLQGSQLCYNNCIVLMKLHCTYTIQESIAAGLAGVFYLPATTC